MESDIGTRILEQINRWAGSSRLAGLTKRLEALDRYFDDDVQVGLDIGTYAVKAVAVQKTIVGERIRQSVYQPIFQDSAVNRLPGTQEIAEAVKKTMEALNVRQRRVWLSLSDADIFIRHIRVPPASEEELAKAVRWEAEKYYPVPPEESIVDFFPIEREKKNQPDELQEVILIVSTRKTVERYLEICRLAGLVPVLMEPSSLAAARGIIHGQAEKEAIIPVIIVGEAVSTIIIIRRKQIFFIKNISINSQEIREAVAHPEGFSLMTDQYQPSTSPDGKSREVGIHELIRQFNRSLAYCEREFLNEMVGDVILCGGNAGLPELKQFLSKVLGRPVSVFDATKIRNDFGGSGPFSNEQAPSMVAAFGAACI